jgi:hypothetical protein
VRPRDLPEAHRAITRAAQEHVQWRSQYVAEVGMSDLLTVTSLIAPRLPTAAPAIASPAHSAPSRVRAGSRCRCGYPART